MNTSNPPAMPGMQQSLDLVATRMNEDRRDLLRAVSVGSVTWHRPPGNSVSHTVWDRGTKRPAGQKRMKTVTGEVNWLRSHGLAKLGKDLKVDSTVKAVVLSNRGRQLLDHLAAAA